MTKWDLIRFTGLHKVFKPFYSGIGHVLMFHRVINDDDDVFNRNIQVAGDYLEDIIKYFIDNKIDIVSLDECYNRITSEDKVKRFVAFTFDDGYADNLVNGLPVFEKYNAPFALFLATGFPDNTIILWWYLLENLVQNSDTIEFGDGEDNYSFKTVTQDEKKEAFWKIRRYIVESNEDNLLSRLMNIFNKSEDEMLDLTKKLALTWDQVVELSDHPLVTIGAHTVSHLALSKLKENRVIEEINESIRIIGDRIKKPVEYLAYPIGSYSAANVREFNITEKCNVKMAFTAKDSNIFRHHKKSLYSLPRIGIDETRGLVFIDLYINGFTPFLNKIIG
jgi:peptidoglycan/xylan/chitin deacetylase (PgdA/CDA1 family)